MVDQISILWISASLDADHAPFTTDGLLYLLKPLTLYDIPFARLALTAQPQRAGQATWLNKAPDRKDRLVEHRTYDGAYISQLVWLYDTRWKIGLLLSYYTLCLLDRLLVQVGIVYTTEQMERLAAGKVLRLELEMRDSRALAGLRDLYI